jgi:hypothetical protein
MRGVIGGWGRWKARQLRWLSVMPGTEPVFCWCSAREAYSECDSLLDRRLSSGKRKIMLASGFVP